MSTELFQRVCRVEIKKKLGASLIIEGLRVAFTVTKTEKECTATVTVTNLSKQTSDSLQSGDFLILTAGYKNSNGVCFSGEIIRFTTPRNETGSDTVFECRSGSKELHKAWLSCSFKSGYSATEVLRDIVSRGGLPVEWKNKEQLVDKPYPAGYAFAGTMIDGIRQVAARVNAEAVVVDNVLFIQPKGGGTPELNSPVLSATTGLLGYPLRTFEEKDKKKIWGWELKSLLFFNARVLGFVKVVSAEIPGQFFVVSEVKHEGDTHGQNWGTTVKVKDL